MRRAIITGAGGFIGRNLIKELLQEKYEILAIDYAVNSDVATSSRVTYLEADLSDLSSFMVPEVWKESDMIFHLAWVGVRPEDRNNLDVQKKNLELSLNVVQMAKELQVPKVIFVGSTMEYCYNNHPICGESLPTPYNCYGSAKIAVRFLCQQFCEDNGIDFNYAIIASIYGVGREDSNVIHYCIKSLLKDESPQVTESLQKWDYIHIEDAVTALKMIGECGKKYAVYGVGTAENQPLKYYLEIIREKVGKTIPISYGAVKIKSSTVANSAVDNSKLKEDTGFSCKYTFERGIEDVIKYYQEA